MAMNNSNPKRRWSQEVDQIESIADTKGVEIDDIEVIEDETDEGDDIVVFRIYETKAETEEDSVGAQVTKMPDVQTGDMSFRNEVQNTLSQLKRYLRDDGDEELETETEGDGGEQSSRTRSRNTNRPEPSGDGPGAQLDAEIEAIHDRMDELEQRIEDLEDKSDALDGLQQLLNDD